MFQDFDSYSDPSQAFARVEGLRNALSQANLDGFLIPHADEHQSEYLPPHAERLAWLTGFTGSAGSAIVLQDTAHIFVDGRYTLQVRQQTDPSLFSYHDLVTEPMHKWLEANTCAGQRIGFDPWLHTVNQLQKLQDATQKSGAILVPISSNPIDNLWSDQPAPPLGRVSLHDESFHGQGAADKLAHLREAISETGAQSYVLTDPSSICWAFNIRGGDIAHTPLVLCFAIINVDGLPKLFIDEKKLSIKSNAYLTQLADLHPVPELTPQLQTLASKGTLIGLDPDLAAYQIRQIIEQAGGKIHQARDPVALPRAIKNETELKGARAAHLRDGVAMCQFLFWLDQQPVENLDEITAAKALESSRRQVGNSFQMPLQDISFDTISGSGANGAIVHYRVDLQSNRKFQTGELYLVDSGGQYQDGTTDITRTVPIGLPSNDQCLHFTLVLKALIAVSVARFPPRATGAQIDAVARTIMWKHGLDYNHGTGHGVGSFLSVHEGPQRFASTGHEPLQAGMILSNEPGYYRADHYGIRIENLTIVEKPAPIEGGEIDMMSFETLTLAPIDRRLIELNLLTPDEISWINDYHKTVFSEISPHLEEDAKAWLETMTAPLLSLS